MNKCKPSLMLGLSVVIIFGLFIAYDYKKPDCVEAQTCVPLPTTVNVNGGCSWSGDIDESGGSYTCSSGKIMRGRRHQGDENGNTQYYCCNIAIN